VRLRVSIHEIKIVGSGKRRAPSGTFTTGAVVPELYGLAPLRAVTPPDTGWGDGYDWGCSGSGLAGCPSSSMGLGSVVWCKDFPPRPEYIPIGSGFGFPGAAVPSSSARQVKTRCFA